MSDSRFHLKAEFSVYGKVFKYDASLNWYAEPGQCDERISKWFADCYEEAYAEFQDTLLALEADRLKASQEQAERQELARLRAKYHDAEKAP
jgi:hypothetical protein